MIFIDLPLAQQLHKTPYKVEPAWCLARRIWNPSIARLKV